MLEPQSDTPQKISENRLEWLKPIANVSGYTSVQYISKDNKLTAVLSLDLRRVQKYLSFMAREFGVDIEVITGDGKPMNLPYDEALAVEAYLDHGSLGKNPIPALFKENEICPPPEELFRSKILQEFRKVIAQFKKAYGFVSLDIYVTNIWNKEYSKHNKVFKFRYDGRQGKRFKTLCEKYNLKQAMHMSEAIELLQFSTSLTDKEKKELQEEYNLLLKWGLLK